MFSSRRSDFAAEEAQVVSEVRLGFISSQSVSNQTLTSMLWMRTYTDIHSFIIKSTKTGTKIWTEPQPCLCTSLRYRKMENENTHPALQISCQKSWKRVPRLYVVVAEWECGAPSCVLSVVLDPSPSLCTSIWEAFLNFLQFGKNRGVETDLKWTWRLRRIQQCVHREPDIVRL